MNVNAIIKIITNNPGWYIPSLNIIRRSQYHLRELRNLNLGIYLPYNLHTLQLVTMQ
jgi:hypothetical protein